MAGFVQKLLEMTLYGSIAIVLVLMFRLLFRKVSKKVTCLFWIVVAIRLLCPVNFSMGVSVGDLIPGLSGEVAPVTAEAVEEDGKMVVDTDAGTVSALPATDNANVSAGVNASILISRRKTSSSSRCVTRCSRMYFPSRSCLRRATISRPTMRK